ncbi:hypothetical protein F511_05591 [Dorcoceras hygrometricum]|uniref:RING-type E3 ubiquitin transferase n=1 Tax=Dorcoceras hygrometricum TaxID=472368 RepID=A0A2Z7AJF3_9LAMI|nr:hypothetical protein F511_05591 [Dorcoceras hygrometricum]
MGILDKLFFSLSILSVVHAHNKYVCPTSFCGDFSLEYPFKLPDESPQNNCTYTNLSCNATLNYGTPIVNLPHVGDFYVRYINYLDTYIDLYDPEGCLMKRLMNNWNLSSSPFKVINQENYTFYTCPSSSNNITPFDFVPIGCLSNATHFTAATSLPTPDLPKKCEIIGTWQLPVFRLGQFDFDGRRDDLYLTWNHNVCQSCEDTDPQQDTGDPTSFWGAYGASPIFMPSVIVIGIVFTVCVLFTFKRRGRSDEIDIQPETATASTAPPHQEGIDDTKINTCTELIVINESKTNSGPDSSSHMCPICLEGYNSQDIVRSIAKCEHCFHADCIELWLRKNITCPVCRTTLSDVE